jgi:hypothetical protein
MKTLNAVQKAANIDRPEGLFTDGFGRLPMRKLGVHSTFELIRYAAKVGSIDIDLWKE